MRHRRMIIIVSVLLALAILRSAHYVARMDQKACVSAGYRGAVHENLLFTVYCERFDSSRVPYEEALRAIAR